MRRGTRRVVAAAACALAALALPAPSAAQASSPPPAGDGAAAPLQSELVTTGLYLVRGGGANTLVRFSANGLVLVDAKAPGSHRALMSQVRRLTKLSDMPVRVLLLTGDDPQCIGNVGAFEAAGVRVVAQSDVAARLPPPAAANVAPRVAFDRDFTLHFGGVTVQLERVGDGATAVLFPDLRVVAVGELLTNDPSSSSLAADGRIARRRAALEQVLKLDFDRVVPASGPVMTRADLEAAVARLGALAALDTLVEHANGASGARAPGY